MLVSCDACFIAVSHAYIDWLCPLVSEDGSEHRQDSLSPGDAASTTQSSISNDMFFSFRGVGSVSEAGASSILERWRRVEWLLDGAQ